jgi:hypothetical protein
LVNDDGFLLGSMTPCAFLAAGVGVLFRGVLARPFAGDALARRFVSDDEPARAMFSKKCDFDEPHEAHTA